MLNHNSLMDEIIPYQFHLSQNYPNPFKEKTVIKYCIASTVRVQLTIYDSKGRLIKKLVDEEQKPGAYEVEFQPMVGGKHLKGGEYYFFLQAGEFSGEKKMEILK